MSKQPILPQSIVFALPQSTVFEYVFLISHHARDDSLVIDVDGLYSRLFILVKTEAQ